MFLLGSSDIYCDGNVVHCIASFFAPMNSFGMLQCLLHG